MKKKSGCSRPKRCPSCNTYTQLGKWCRTSRSDWWPGLLRSINEARKIAGAPCLATNDVLSAFAQTVADSLKETTANGKRAASLLQIGGAKNICQVGVLVLTLPCCKSPQAFINAWLADSANREVLLGRNYRQLGIGFTVSGEIRSVVLILGQPGCCCKIEEAITPDKPAT